MKLRHTAMNEALLTALCMSNLFVEGEPAAAPGGGTMPSASEVSGATPKAKAPRKAKAAKAKKPAAKKLAAKGKRKVKAKKASSGGKPAEALKRARKDYNVDKKHKTAGGNTSVNCGDSTAKALLGKPLSDVYEKAAKVKGVSAGTLKNKYKHLNEGMQRMTLGNMIRAAA